MLLKTIGLEVDEVVADLEDSVAADVKESARELVATVLAGWRESTDGKLVPAALR
jgi:citrate lyase beta subunit